MSSSELSDLPEITRSVLSEDGRVYLVEAAGDLDLTSAPALSTSLEAAEASDAPSVVLDMTGVTFLDSSAINVVLRHRSRLLDLGRTLELRAPVPAVRRVLEVTGLAAVLLGPGSDGEAPAGRL